MKNILFTLCLLLCASLGYSQVKVFADGDTKIGTTGTAPVAGAKLDIAGRLAISESTGTRFIVGSDDLQNFVTANNTTVTGSRAYLQMNGGNASSGNEGNFTFGGTRLYFRTNVTTSGTGSARGFWAPDGNLGINNFAPAEKLHVNGNIQISGGSLITSDRRLKKDIKPFEDGLETLLKIQPVTFKYNNKIDADADRTYVGVIAQEVQEIAPYMVDTYDVQNIADESAAGEVELTKSEEYLRVSSADIQYLLVNAVKEQQEMIATLTDQVQELQEIIANGGGNQSIVLQGDGNAFLGQNHPNPYTSFTTIEYELPQDVSSGKVQFFNMAGQLIKTVDVSDKVGSIQVSAEELPSGTYSYSLIIDNTRVASKKMIYTK